MTTIYRCLSAGLMVLAISVLPNIAAAETADKYTLRYRFKVGEVLRWEVEHRAKTDTTIEGDSQTADTLSKSVKAWRVQRLGADGSATFEHTVEWIEMRQRLTGREEVCYDSRTDKEPPTVFQQVAKSVGVPLSVVTVDPQGKVLERVRTKARPKNQSEGEITIPLPEEPVAVGHVWSFIHDVSVPLNTGGIRKVKTQQRFKLAGVKTGVATIEVSNHLLTPIDDPKLESQLLQRQSSGTVKFDIDAGRVLSQRMELDKRVVGFSGPTSSIHYATRFSERLLPPTSKVATRPTGR
ncbi:MAG: hypothetical protein V3R99_06965 [Thermoguttaceae bacterium]